MTPSTRRACPTCHGTGDVPRPGGNGLTYTMCGSCGGTGQR